MHRPSVPPTVPPRGGYDQEIAKMKLEIETGIAQLETLTHQYGNEGAEVRLQLGIEKNRLHSLKRAQALGQRELELLELVTQLLRWQEGEADPQQYQERYNEILRLRKAADMLREERTDILIQEETGSIE